MNDRNMGMWSPVATALWLIAFLALGMVLSAGARGELQPILILGYAGIMIGFIYGVCRHDIRALERRIARLEATNSSQNGAETP
jgi:hypothetical protein